nr:hypothetical protein [Tanacetum cinerariifolium]
MEKSWMNIAHRLSDLDFAYHNKKVSSKVPCPCKGCNNYRKHSRPTILRHLMQRGITISYENWIHHGEPYDDLDDSDNDMPISEDSEAYNMLSSWTDKGYNACPTCMNETSSRYLCYSKNICYMVHRRFLPPSRQWRRDKTNFNGKVDYWVPVAPKSRNEILNEIDYSLNTRKCKSLKDKQGWKKRVCFLSFRIGLNQDLRHNIDIMHVVKNAIESLTAMIFNIKGKTKDTWKSRRDLMDERLKKSLHLRSQSKSSSLIMHMACYHLTKDEKQKILGFLKLLKFPDGYASNISGCIKGEEFK